MCRRTTILRCLFFFFFKQKTAYEMRISDWSSDVCSSDLDRVDIAAARVLDPLGAPDLRGFGERRLLRQPRLDLRLVGVGQLEAVGAEQFDAVIGEGLVAGRDPHAKVGAHRGNQKNRKSVV